MEQYSVKIDGMSCMHCAKSVQKTLDGLDGVDSAAVEIGKADVKYNSDKIDKKTIDEAIVKAGYKVL